MKQKQLSFFKAKDVTTKEFGGALLTHKRKSRRPIDTKRALHLIFKADISKSGSLLKHRQKIEKIMEKYAHKFGVKIYSKALAGNHIHTVVKVPHRENYHAFVRTFTGVTAKLLNIKWLLRPFTRILEWGRDLKNAFAYVIQNDLEARGIIPYQPRKRKPPS